MTFEVVFNPNPAADHGTCGGRNMLFGGESDVCDSPPSMPPPSPPPPSPPPPSPPPPSPPPSPPPPSPPPLPPSLPPLPPFVCFDEIALLGEMRNTTEATDACVFPPTFECVGSDGSEMTTLSFPSSTVAYSNLGNLGPNFGSPEEINFQVRSAASPLGSSPLAPLLLPTLLGATPLLQATPLSHFLYNAGHRHASQWQESRPDRLCAYALLGAQAKPQQASPQQVWSDQLGVRHVGRP